MKYILSLLVLFAQVFLLSGQDTGERLLQSEAYIRRGMTQQAISECTDAITAESDYRLFLKRGQAYLKQGDLIAAEKDFIEANRLMKDSGDLGLAESAAAEGNSRRAVAYLENHLMSGFKLPEKELMLDNYLSKIEDTPEWRDLWKKNWYNQLEEGLAEVEYLVRQGKMGEAREVADGLRGMYSDKAETLYMDGIILMASNDLAGAAEKIGLAIEGGYDKYKAYVNYFRALEQSERYTEAVNEVKEAMNIFPDRPELLLYLSECLGKMGDREEGLLEADKYLELFPDDRDALESAGELALGGRQYSRALKYLSENVENNPGDASVFVSRGNAYFASRSWEFAVADYSMALDIDPYNGATYYNKGYALIRMGRTEDACHDLKQALRLGDNRASDLISRYCIR